MFLFSPSPNVIYLNVQLKQFHKCWNKNTNHDLQITHIHLKSLRKTLFFTVQILQISNRNHCSTTISLKLCSGDHHLISEYFLFFWHKEQKSIKEFCSNLPVALVKQEAMMGKMSWVKTEDTKKSLGQRAHVQEGQKQGLSLSLYIWKATWQKGEDINKLALQKISVWFISSAFNSLSWMKWTRYRKYMTKLETLTLRLNL